MFLVLSRTVRLSQLRIPKLSIVFEVFVHFVVFEVSVALRAWPSLCSIPLKGDAVSLSSGYDPSSDYVLFTIEAVDDESVTEAECQFIDSDNGNDLEPDRPLAAPDPLRSPPFGPKMSVLGAAPTVDRSRDSGPETVGMSRPPPLDSLKTANRSKAQSARNLSGTRGDRNDRNWSRSQNGGRSTVRVQPAQSPPTPPQKKELLSPSLRPTATRSRSARSGLMKRSQTQTLSRSRSPFGVEFEAELFEHSAIRTVSVLGPNPTLRSELGLELSPSADFIVATPSGDRGAEDPLKCALLDDDDEKALRRRQRVVECRCDDIDAVDRSKVEEH